MTTPVHRPEAFTGATTSSALDHADLEGARPAPLPRQPSPQLATATDTPPEGDGWLHEIKLDGYRLLARIEAGRVQLLTRNGHDWSDRLPRIAAALAGLPLAAGLVDGELVALGSGGLSVFRDLQRALADGDDSGLTYQVFDLLHADGLDLTGMSLRRRKAALSAVLVDAGLEPPVPDGPLRYTDHLQGSGPAFYQRACRLGLEGIIAKRADAGYRGGRNRHWLKIKCRRDQELVIGGWTEPGGARQGFGALLLGGWRDGRLVYAGRVGTGFSDRQLSGLQRRLQDLETAAPPFDPPPRVPEAHWTEPRLVADVSFSDWTAEGRLRHPVFRGLREDRDAAGIKLPDAALAGRPEPPGQSAAGRRPVIRVGGVRLTNPGRVLYPEQGLTKLALAHYYQGIAERMLPALAGRPLSLLRCPEGREAECFFQKHPAKPLSARFPRLEVPGRAGRETKVYATVRTPADLIALVQAGTLELHVWGSRAPDLEHPDQLVLDLDPGPDLGWSVVVETARSLAGRLDQLGLASFVRTTGGKGLHLVVPLTPACDWSTVKTFAHAVAAAHAADDPRRLTVNMAKSRRRGRIFIDYLRNGRGATAIASWSTRARPGAPVAVPLAWDELSTAVTSDRFTVNNVQARLAAVSGDPWDGFEAARRPLTRDLLVAAGAGEARSR
jgi:bifunctional non-homologous end joining protein LigD